jgi:hypothetical protein
MKFKINPKGMMRFGLLIIPIFILILFACATVPVKEYEETVSQWKSYEDVGKWMEVNFVYDFERYHSILRGKETIYPRSASQTFALKSGVCTDGAYFAKETLNQINPEYKAKVVFINVSMKPGHNHYVCSFEKDGKIYIMDYATAYSSMRGIHGPFNSLHEYKKYYETRHPVNKDTISVTYTRW